MKKVHIFLFVSLLFPFFLVVSSPTKAQNDDKKPPMNQIRAPLDGTLTDGTISYTLSTAASDGTTSNGAEFTVGGVNHLWETWWWYRIDGDAQETRFPAPDTENYVGNVATLTWTNVDTRGFGATLVATVLDTSGGAGTIGEVQQDMTIVNNSGGDLGIDMFAYTDLDLNNTDDNDSATLNAANYLIDMTDPSGTTAQLGSNFESNGAYMVGPWAGSALHVLNDAAVTNLGNIGLPSAANTDFTAAFQEGTRTIANGESVTYTSGFAVDTTGGGASTAPTAVSLQSITATNNAAILPILIATLLLALAGGVALRQRAG